MSARAAVVTVGSELVEGLRVDTNTAEIARAVSRCGFSVVEAVSVGDDRAALADALRRLLVTCDLVVTTGGLGPTHDDMTREAAADALGRCLTGDSGLKEWLASVVRRHKDAAAAEQVLRQAEIIDGARVIHPTTGTAPGQIVRLDSGATLVLLPGPPAEMRPMLKKALEGFQTTRAEARELGVVGLTESDAQVIAQRAISDDRGVALTVLARPGDVRVVLIDAGAGTKQLDRVAQRVVQALGPSCYSSDGSDLATAVVGAARNAGVTFSAAESCTGGLVSSAVTSVAGASDVFAGGVVAYANRVKADLLNVPEGLLAQYGAVSEETAKEMASGVRMTLGTDIGVSVTGIAGPGGGTAEKPVGLVWFAVSTSTGTVAVERRFAGGSRAAIRDRATATALDLVRRSILGIALS